MVMKQNTVTLGAKVVALLLMVMFVFPNDLQAQSYKFYRGFFDCGISVDPTYQNHNQGRFSYGYVSTTHGYYVGDRTFVGIGAALTFDEEALTLPLYAAVKYNLSFTKMLTPTFELRAGPYFDLWNGDRAAFYGDAAVGLRLALGGRVALNMMLNLTYQQGFCQWRMVYPPYGGDWVGITEELPLSIGARVGVEF